MPCGLVTLTLGDMEMLSELVPGGQSSSLGFLSPPPLPEGSILRCSPSGAFLSLLEKKPLEGRTGLYFL